MANLAILIQPSALPCFLQENIMQQTETEESTVIDQLQLSPTQLNSTKLSAEL